MVFNEITFANGIVTIVPTEGENKTYNLLTNPISIKVTTLGTTWDAVINENPNTPDFKSSIPFGKVGDLAKLKFGKIDTVIDYKVQTLRTSTVEYDYTLAVKPAFYMIIIGESQTPGGTIGTDDMRNGKANTNIFSLEGAAGVYLNLAESNSQYTLEVGYQKPPEN